MGKVNEPENDIPNIGSPARRALAGAGITRMSQLTSVTEADLARLHGVGPKAIRILRQALEAQGLSFAPEHKG